MGNQFGARSVRVSGIVSLGGIACTVFAFGCGGSTPTDEQGDSSTLVDAGSGDGNTDQGHDAAPGEDAATAIDSGLPAGYPAAHAAIPLILNNGGPVLTAPEIVTVTWKGDAFEQRLQAFGTAIHTSAWWTAVSSEYGLGQATVGADVVIPSQASPTYTDTQIPGASSPIKDMIASNVADGTFPAPTANTLYVIYLPQGVSVSLDGQPSCVQGGIGGYHMSASVTPPGGTAVDVSYAIVPRCPQQGSSPPKYSDYVTSDYASHEIIEACTDAKPVTQGIAWMMRDPLWRIFGGEVADLCVDVTGSGNDIWGEAGFAFQRSWSNKSVSAGHNPCVPIPTGEVYFNVAPAAGKSIVNLAVGGTATIELDAFSDAPTPAWSVNAIDIGQAITGSATSSLSINFDKTMVQNGDTIQMTITLKSAPPALPAQYPQNAAIYVIEARATAGTAVHLWPAMVQVQ